MAIKKFLLLLSLSVVLFGAGKAQTASQNSGGKKPDLSKMAYEDIKWAKSEGSAFWFYHKPSQYFFDSREFETISLENGDFIAFIYELDRYVLLPDYLKAGKKVEKAVEPITNSNCVFIRINRSRFWIYDKGKYVDHLESVGFNSTYHQYIYRSATTDKRYFISEKDFLYGPMYTALGITSE
ncbi:MAG: hypothetical protein JWQ30_1648 [Sediminibacterium sp.]|nr:hypothetical protein [Sediminibacterium sp.]